MTTSCPHCGHRLHPSTLPHEEMERLEGELWWLRQQLEFEVFQEGMYFEQMLANQEVTDEDLTSNAYQLEQKCLKLIIWELEYQLGVDINPP